MGVLADKDQYEHFRIMRREDGSLWKLGSGAMGITFKAVDSRLESLVALKVIGANALGHAAGAERFRREARAAASVRHPNVASVYHFGQEGPDFFYAMEFVDGQSISQVVRSQGPLSLATALAATRQAASALAAVHARHLVHRDVKPDNLMFTHEEDSEDQTRNLKLIDFGLAKQLLGRVDSQAAVLTEGFLGTPYYASPEQCEESECDIRSDIYSLGSTLWFMLTGRPPFEGNLFRVMDQHVQRSPPFDALGTNVPPEVRQLLARMLAKQPADRPQTPAELRRALDECLTTPTRSAPGSGETVAESIVLPVGHEPLGRTATAGLSRTSTEITPSHFPVPLSRFFGRESELELLGGWLRDGQRLITLTGPGGTGKTRLALEVAHRAASTLGLRLFVVQLADLTDARLLARRVRDALLPAAALEAAESSSSSLLLAQITTALAAAPCLLLLDNFEQFAETSSDFVDALLARVPCLCCVITSRRQLNLSGERGFAVPPLDVPKNIEQNTSVREIQEFASVRLFCDRAQAVRSDFKLDRQNAAAVIELCQRVEGIPLAIELAAARSEVLTPQEIVGRLRQSLNVLVSNARDVAARHRTLRATLDWSFELLPTELRLYFARLSVFRGGWTAEAAAAVFGDEANLDEALGHLSALRRFSLILAEPSGETMRFRMLETIRQYAGQQLICWGDQEAASTRRRHLDFYLNLAVLAEPELRKSQQGTWLARLETEHANFRTALESTENGEPALLRLTYCLHRFWMIHNYLVEGREWLSRALVGQEEGGLEADKALIAKTSNAAGVLAWAAGDLVAAQEHLERSLALFETMGDHAGTASALNNLGLAASEQADPATARLRYEASLKLYRQMDLPALQAAVLNNLGQVLCKEQNYSQARECLEESLRLEGSASDQYNRANILASLGEVEAREGNIRRAYQRFEECLGIRSEIGDKDNFELYWRMATLAAWREDKPEAARLLGAADALRRSRSLAPSVEVAKLFETDVAAVCQGMEGEAFATAWGEGQSYMPEDLIRLCRGKFP